MRVIVVIFSMFIVFKSYAVNKVWVGTGGNKLWNNNNNWLPAGTPGTLDDVIVNISDSIEVNQAVNINSLTITNNVTVKFSTTTTSRTISLSSTSSPIGLGLLIDAGCTVYIQSLVTGATTVSLALDMTSGIGVTGEIYGTLVFRKVGAGTGSTNNRLDLFSGPLAYGKLVVKNGGVILYEPTTSNTAAAGTPYNTLTMENGSSYIINKDGGSFPIGVWQPNSIARNTGFVNGLCSFNGTDYGNLEWNSSSQIAVNYFNKDLNFNNVNLINTGTSTLRIKTGSSAAIHTIKINGNLTIDNTAKFEFSGPTVSVGSGGVVQLLGNLINNGLILETGLIGTNDTLLFMGATNQAYSGTGTISDQLTFKIDNPAGVTLNSPLALPYFISLVNGRLNTTASNILILSSTSNVISGASAYTNVTPNANYGTATSYVNGPMRWNGLSAVASAAFPVGDVNLQRPIFLENVTGDYTVEYVRSNPWTFGLTLDPSLDHTSSLEYWLISKNSASGQANVKLTYYDPNSGGVTNVADLRVARWSGTLWANEGNTATQGTAGTNGAVTSGVVSNFSPFTLASINPNNPLPVKDIKLSYSKNNSLVNLKWSVIGDEDVVYYSVERSNDGLNFVNDIAINSRKETGIAIYTSNGYTCTTVTYFRIKAVLHTGEIAYSSIVVVPVGKIDFMLYPNPAKSNIQITTSYNNTSLLLTDALGKIVKVVSLKNNAETIDVSHFSNGIYFATLMNAGKLLKTIYFVKE
jgi:hypothetical protein